MWNNGVQQGEYNEDEEDDIAQAQANGNSHSGGGYMAFTSTESQQHHPQQEPNLLDIMMQNTQAQHAFFNNTNFAQNQMLSANNPISRVSSPLNIPLSSSPRPAMDARAAELKAQLLRKRNERSKSGTPPVIPALASHSRPTNMQSAASAFQEYQKISGASNRDHPMDGNASSDELTLDDLISAAKTTADAKVDQEFRPTPRRITSAPMQQPEVNDVPGTFRIVPVTRQNGDVTVVDEQHSARNANQSHRMSIGSSEVSEEDIRDSPIETQPSLIRIKGQSTNTIRSNGQLDTSIYSTQGNAINGQASTPRDQNNRQASRPQISRQQSFNKEDDTAKSTRNRIDAQPAGTENNSHTFSENMDVPKIRHGNADAPSDHLNAQRRVAKTPEPSISQRQEHQEFSDSHAIYAPEQPKQAVVSHNVEPPTLAALLEVDKDLKDWLDLTNYFKVEERNKQLNRRRALAALDAQRAKIMEEIEQEGRGPSILPSASHSFPIAMPPPSTPVTKTASVKPVLNAPAESPEIVDVIHKRTRSDFEGIASNNVEEPRRDHDENKERKVTKLADGDDRRPASRGNSDEIRPRSARKLSFGNDKPIPTEPRGRLARSRSPRTRDFPAGPDYRARSPLRRDTRDRSRPDRFYDSYRGDQAERDRTVSDTSDPALREYVRRLGTQNSDDSRRYPFGHRIANEMPYITSKPLNLGGRGATKYFIVKSFNEENVLKAIRDGIWTTQLHNLEPFRDAFLSCKNVILCFSINQSKAFQGFARMQGVPGSVETPSWQEGINWESTGAFQIQWQTICSVSFSIVGHLRNTLNDHVAVHIGKDGQEIEERCGAELVRLIDEEAERILRNSRGKDYLGFDRERDRERDRDRQDPRDRFRDQHRPIKSEKYDEPNIPVAAGGDPTQTCWYWAQPGRSCHHKDGDCKFAHYHTGKVVKVPPTVEKKNSRYRDSEVSLRGGKWK